jgi:hypothetical protein
MIAGLVNTWPCDPEARRAVLTRGGIADAWCGEPESRRRTEASLAEAGMETPTLAVSGPFSTAPAELAITEAIKAVEAVGASLAPPTRSCSSPRHGIAWRIMWTS